MSSVSPKQLALLKAQLNAARISALETHKTVAGSGALTAQNILPFLDNCARELEETAQLIRATADAAAAPAHSGCSG